MSDRQKNEKDDSCAGLTGQAIPTGAETEPRLTPKEMTVDEMIRAGFTHDQIINERLRRLEVVARRSDAAVAIGTVRFV